MPADRQTIRRRRLVLAILVVCAIGLLTATFGGGVNAVQRGVTTVISPVQDVASRALKPARDLVGWVGDTFDAKGENERLRAEVATLRQRRVDVDALSRQNVELRKLSGLGQRIGTDQMGPEMSRVIGRTPTLFNQVLTIDKGQSDGLSPRDPVISAAGRVGEIGWPTRSTAGVELVTDPDFGVGAKISSTGRSGTVVPATGAPRELILQYVEGRVDPKQVVVTAGTSSASRFPSLFPADVPIGVVSSIEDASSDSQQVHVRPYVDVRDLDYVQVLTDVARSRGT